MRFKYQIQPEFVVTQHKRDVLLLKEMQAYFKNIGEVKAAKGKEDKTANCYRFRVRKLSSLTTVIIPFFEKYPLKTKKNEEFLRFKELCFLLEKKVHLQSVEQFNYCYILAQSIPYNIVLKLSRLKI